MPSFLSSALWRTCLVVLASTPIGGRAQAESPPPLTISSVPVEVTVRQAGETGVRITAVPVAHEGPLPENPALVERNYPDPVLTLRHTGESRSAQVGAVTVTTGGSPLTIKVAAADGRVVQQVTLQDNGRIEFLRDNEAILGMGEGGPRPTQGVDWRQQEVEFNRSGRTHAMQPRWQAGAYGSRNPVPLLASTKGWGLYLARPWGRFLLHTPDRHIFIPIAKQDPERMRQDHGNQTEQLGKGIPPMEESLTGFCDLFVFDTSDPVAFMKDLAGISGPAVMPPKWSLGYMQSHRTLEDDKQLVAIADTFREKQIPCDALIYLGTGFTPRGWNKRQPSFEFNPEVFKRDPAEVIADLHERNMKVAVHVVPWDRDKLPLMNEAAFEDYWKDHEPLVKAGVDGWWPDEGDWFDLHERLRRHQFYHEAPQISEPNKRPWSLHRNGHLGVARWGGWVWSGDTDSTWKTLEAQIAVGINHSLSLGPYWGSDIGGFFPTPELTGELYARWFQFGAFCPSFRSHGRTWWTRLPWGWGLDTLGPDEHNPDPDPSALNDPEIEAVCRQYAELRYQLLSYNYSLAWETRQTGLPFMRALWLHYPQDKQARETGDAYLWGRELLVAPVYEKGATSRATYLPAGTWYDYWTNSKLEGNRIVSRKVDLTTMPLFVRAGAIIPTDPIRQHTGQKVDEPLTVRIYRGADGAFTLYEDDGESFAYLKGDYSLLAFNWDDATSTLTIAPGKEGKAPAARALTIEVLPEGTSQAVEFKGEPLKVSLPELATP